MKFAKLGDVQETENSELLASFVAHCEAHPSERFWQALRNWSGHNFILASASIDDPAAAKDTFYWKQRDGR